MMPKYAEDKIKSGLRTFFEANDVVDKVSDWNAFSDPSNHGIVEFKSAAAARG